LLRHIKYCIVFIQPIVSKCIQITRYAGLKNKQSFKTRLSARGIVFASIFTGINITIKAKHDKKMKNNNFPHNLKLISPLLITGVLLILLLIFTFTGIDRLDRQKDFSTQRSLEKGISLIRTFEAGTRAGMFTMQWGAKRIQNMLAETSMQPEVEYLMITSKDGHIRAHSNASMVGQFLDSMPEITKQNRDPGLIFHRLIKQADGVSVFEVMKRFTPIESKFRRRHLQMHDKPYTENREDLDPCNEKDWCQPYFKIFNNKPPKAAEHYIFAGLSTKRAEHARNKLLKETIVSGFVFFLLVCAGIFALFTFQAYRSTRASLDSVKAFSDNVIQHMPVGLITISTDHTITSMNKIAKDIFGEKLTTSNPQIIELIKKMETHQNTLNQEMNFIIKPDLTIPLDITVSSITNSEDKIIEFLFLVRDLTQIRELKKQVETNRRLAAIGKLAAGVAHEIRNPLSSIKGFVTYLGKKHDSSTSDKETTQIMVGEVERINRSITQLLEFAKPMEVDKNKVDINDLILHSLKLVQTDFDKKNIKTNVNISTQKHSIYTDKDRMNQVLLNLYINAIEALETGGSLEIQVMDTKEDDFIEIRIQDNGIGIDDNFLDQIFDPYFTTKPTGTGLGLSIVHRIIETLKGTISVESVKEQGSCFIIKIPVS
jgi:two-component system, NtrC family, sensor histidine kinase HydH